MGIQRIKVPIVTSAGGAFSLTTHQVMGKFLQMRFVQTDLDTGWDLTIDGNETGLVLFSGTDLGTSNFTKAIRQPTHDTAGAASLYAATGEPVEDFIYVNEKLDIVVAQGGNTKSGTLWLWFHDE